MTNFGPKLFACLILLTASGIQSAQSQDMLYPDELAISQYLSDYYAHPSLILKWDKKTEYVKTLSGRFVEDTFKLRYLIIDDEASQWTNVSLDFPANEEIKGVRVVIRHTDGSTSEYGRDDLLLPARDESFQVRFPLARVEKGAIIDIQYEVRKEFFDNGGRSFREVFRFEVPAIEVTYLLSLPSTMDYKVRQTNALEKIVEKPYEKVGNTIAYGNKALIYQAKLVEAFIDESMSPELEEVADILEVQLLRSQLAAGFSNKNLTWKRLASEYTSYAIDRDRLFRSPVSPTAKEICYKHVTDSSKVASVFKYIDSNILIDNTSTNDTFARVLKQGSGNMYLVNGLASTLLAECGVDNQFVLVRPSSSIPFDSTFVTSHEFVAPGLQFTIDERQTYAFPFLNNFPIGHIPEPLQGSQAMIIDKDGLVGFDILPESSPFDKPFLYEMSIDLDEDGGVNVHELSSSSGTIAHWSRQRYREMDSLQVENTIRTSIEYDYIFDIYDIQLNNLEESNLPLQVELKYKMPGQTVVTPKEVVFMTSGIFQNYSRSIFKIDPSERTNPIKLGAELDIIKEISVTYPEEWTLQKVPDDVLLENQFGTASITYESNAGELLVRQEITWNSGLYPKEDYGESIDLIGENSRIYLKSLVFDRGS